MIQKLFLLLLITTPMFSQSALVIPYITQEKIGMQLNPIIAGMKSTQTNQETELNFALYYQDSYLLEEEQVLGHLEGRLISEKALSEFDLLQQIQNDRSTELSNYGETFKIYQDALKQFRTYQELDPTIPIDSNSTEYYYYYDDQGDSSGAQSTEDGVYYYDDTTQANSKDFQQINQNFVANDINYSSSVTNITPPLMSEEELRQLIYIQKLKQEYQSVLSQYNSLIEQEQKIKETNSFDPGNPTESFTILILGEDFKGAWTKTFRLDGTNNYQSYNSEVWYLGYNIPITKRDLRLLYNVFTRNKKIRYIVNGISGNAEFELSSYFIAGVKELLELYAQGKLKRNVDTSIPILQSNKR